MELINYENIELVIFDCDGVLIDSEILSAKVLSEQFVKIGIPINEEYVKENFVGHSYPKIEKHLIDNFNTTLDDNFEDLYRTNLLKSFENDLRIIPGIEFVLQNLSIPKCVATSSSLERATNSLEIVGIFKYLKENLFSAYNMGSRGKPAPDIYLNAAKKFGVKPKNVLVIEDSLLGIEGAKKAGMIVCHFIGASHLKNWDTNHNYTYEPNYILKDMNDFFNNLSHLKNPIMKEN